MGFEPTTLIPSGTRVFFRALHKSISCCCCLIFNILTFNFVDKVGAQTYQKVVLKNLDTKTIMLKYSDLCVTFYLDISQMHISSNISKTSAMVASGFQTRKTFETTRPQA